MTESDRPTLSIVIPVFNEEENIPILADEIRRALEPIETVTLTDRGRRLREFTILWGREFRGFPARPFAGY